ncbi:MAG: hypothetical protein GX363_10355 [Clostridiales bacterium]|nr:hypothetical protein [Clostridiales bacterium]
MKISKKTTELNHKKTSFYDKLTINISVAIRGIEIFLSCLLIICVVISSIYLIAHFIKDVTLINTLVDYDTLQHFLSYLLLLIIALELAMMLIKHTPNNVVDVTIYAIARKMLIYNTSSSDMLLGVITLSILFFVKHFLIKEILTPNAQDKKED